MTLTTTWDDERIETLRTLFADGLSARQIGEVLGCSRNAIIGKSHRLGLLRPLGARPASRPGRPKSKPDTSPHGARADRLIKHRARTRAQSPASSPAEHVAGHKTFFELRHDDCRWSVGEMERGQHTFCGNRVIVGKAYCPEHWNMVYVKPRVR